MATRKGIFYGWWIVLATVLSQIFAMGSTVIAFGLFIKPVGDELELGRAVMNTGLVFWMVGFALGCPFVGKLVDKIDIRKVMLGGAVLMAVGFALLSQVSSGLWMALLLVFAIGPGSAALGPITCAKLVANWFHRHLSKALGLSAIGASAGGVVLLPFITLVMDSYGWRATLLVEALIAVLLIGPIVWLMVVNAPQVRGLQMDGDDQSPQLSDEESTTGIAQWGFAAISKAPVFWILVYVAGIMGMVGQALLPTLIPYSTDAGIDLKIASLMVSVWSAGAVSGKLVLGFLGDSMNKVRLFMAMFVIMISVCSVMLLVPGYQLLLVASVFGGVASGAMLPLINGIVAENFGRESFGTVNGFLSPMIMLVSMVGVWYIGASYDSTGNYSLALQVFIGFMILAGFLLLLVRKPRAPGIKAEAV